MSYEFREYSTLRSRNYERGRALPAAVSCAWLQALTRQTGNPRGKPNLDVGSGAGRFTSLLQEATGTETYGLEPSAAMTNLAQVEHSRPHLHFVRGRAEQIPFRDGTFGVVLLSFSWHQLSDQSVAAAELFRVLRRGGRLLLRTQFRDSFPKLWWYKAFPDAEAADRRLYQDRATTVATLQTAGFSVEDYERVRVHTGQSRGEAWSLLQEQALSLFTILTPRQVEKGMEAVGELVKKSAEQRDVYSEASLLALSRPNY